jgi:membrane protease YdiL (CAAX protease family)
MSPLREARHKPLIWLASAEPPDQSESLVAGRDAYWALGAGVLYLTAVWFQPLITSQLIGTSPITPERIRADGDLLILAMSAIRLLGLVLVLLLIAWPPRRQLRAALRPERPTWVFTVVGVTIFVTLFLNNSDIWPFVWRYRFSESVGWVRSYVAGNHLFAMLGSLALTAFASPLIEEVIFRFGLLQSLLQWTHSRVIAVAVSSVLFGAMHLGYPIWHPSMVEIRSAISLTLFAVVLAIMTLERRGRITGAIAVHMAYNGFSAAMLLYGATSS